MTLGRGDEKIIAKGLKSPGPLLLVKKRLQATKAKHLRVIVSDTEAANELISYFREHDAKTEIDRAGDDLHVIVDLSNFKDVD